MKKIVLALSIVVTLNATTLLELFDALKHHSQTKVDEMAVEKAEVYKDLANANLYPKINLFAKFDNYTAPTGMLPVPPDELFAMIKDPSVGQPFSNNILREGVNFSMPLFVKAIYTSADQAAAMQESAVAKKRINLLKNEALIVGANANFLYLNALEKSLEAKEQSLRETHKTLQIKVDNGRASASTLYKIEDGLNQISISKNSIKLQKEKLLSTIESITSIRLSKPIVMQEAMGTNSENGFTSLEPLENKIKASRVAVSGQKDRLYPALLAYGSYTFSQGDAYNNGKRVNEEYGNIGIVLNIPLLSMGQYSQITKAKIELQSNELELQKEHDTLSAKAKMLENSLPLLQNSIDLSQQSIKNKDKLLKIAKINYKSGRLSTEEYLRYEDDVVSAKAKYYQAKAQRWQTFMELAVIYGNNIEEMVK